MVMREVSADDVVITASISGYLIAIDRTMSS